MMNSSGNNNMTGKINCGIKIYGIILRKRNHWYWTRFINMKHSMEMEFLWELVIIDLLGCKFFVEPLPL